jgi:serine/threonine-protein kinase
MLRRGVRLGKYRLDKRLGRGAFADVWKARDVVETRDVALKIALESVVEEHGREALEREARIATRLSHPNVVAIRNADWIESRFVLASDLAKCNLADYPGARRSGAVALRVVRDVAAGLAHAHARKLMHRDVKPENVLIFSDGRAALTDFGVSRFARAATQTYTEAGTLGYMAPEQAYGRPTLASDVFSLGMIACELLTGVLPSWPFSWPPPGFARFKERVPEPVQPVLRKAAEFDPRRRYADAVALHRALESAFGKSTRERPVRRTPARRRPAPSPLAAQAELFRRQHGARLDMRYRCYRCDGAIAESMSYCPWCGTGENSFIEVSSYPLVCPECEHGVRREWTACPWCYPGRLEGNGRKPRFDPRAERTCSRRGCEGQLRPFMRYCPLCKQKVRRTWTDPALPERCSRCGWRVSREFFHYCPWCGRKERGAGGYVGRRR